MSKPLTDAELLTKLLETELAERLTDAQREAFGRMDSQGYALTVKQAQWIRGVAERLGIQTAPSENIFSAMSPEKQARQRAAASKVKLPWEK
jgi:hypothetical protein